MAGDFEILGSSPAPAPPPTRNDLTKQPGYDPATDIYQRPPPSSAQPSGTGTGDQGFEILGSEPAPTPGPPSLQALKNKGMDYLREQEKDIDYTTGAPFIVRTQVQGADNAAEAYKVLSHFYGEKSYGKGFGQDRFGQWWVKQDGKRVAVLPHGLLGAFQNILSGAGSSPWTTAGGIAGGIGGELLFPAGGGVPGMAIGAAIGRGLDDLQHYALSIFDKTPDRVAGTMFREGAIAGAFGTAGPALRYLGRPIKRGIQQFLGTRDGSMLDAMRGGTRPVEGRPGIREPRSQIKESSRFGREMGARNSGNLPQAVPPISSYAPGATSMAKKSEIRDLLAGPGGSHRENQNVIYLNARLRGVLNEEGFSEGEVNQFMNEVRDTSSSLSGRAAGDVMVREANKISGRLTETFEGTRRQVARDLDRTASNLRMMTQAPDALAENVSDAIVMARRKFAREMGQLYEDVDRTAGNQPIVPTAAIQAMAEEITALMPPNAVPPLIQRAATGQFVKESAATLPPPSAPGQSPLGSGGQMDEIRQMMERLGGGGGGASETPALHGLPEAGAPGEPQHFITLQQAHALRTWAREQGAIQDIAGQGIGPHNWRKLAAAVDDAIDNAQGNTSRLAATQLRNTDSLYREGIRKFTHAEMNQLVRDARSGMLPDPKVTAARIMNPDNVNFAKEIFSIVPSHVKNGIVQADLAQMLETAQTWSKERGFVLDGRSLLTQLENRDRLLKATYPPGLVRQLRLYATELAAFDGQIDVNAIAHGVQQPTQTLRLIEEAVGANRANEEFVKRNVIGAFVNGTPARVDAGLRMVLRPGNEPVTEDVANTFGRNSEAWKTIQRLALQRVLSGSTKELPSLQKVIEGEAIDRALSRYTPRQQELLFPGGLADDLRTLSKEAKYLFPRSTGDTHSSLAAGAIKMALPRPDGWYRLIRIKISGWISDHPRVLRYLTDEVKNDPARARATMKVLGAWIITRANRGEPQGQPPTPTPGTELGPRPKVEDRAPATPGYGGE
jgi:hypothetical protein